MISPFLCENVNSHPCLTKASLPLGLSRVDVKYYYYYFFTFPIRGGAVNVCLHFDSKRCTVIVIVDCRNEKNVNLCVRHTVVDDVVVVVVVIVKTK
jgi:hypothetical protein